MLCTIDLRYFIPPLLNLLFKFFHFQFGPNWHQMHHTSPLRQFLINWASLSLVAFAALFFLLISAKLALNVRVTANAIHLQAIDFSVPLAMLLLCSILLPHPHFWVAFGLIICISPWIGLFLNLVNRILDRTTLNIICIHEEEPPQVELELTEIDGNPQQEQETSGDDIIIVIDKQV